MPTPIALPTQGARLASVPARTRGPQPDVEAPSGRDRTASAAAGDGSMRH